MKRITRVALANTHTSMKARVIKNENQMKSSFFRGNISTRKGDVSYFIPLLDKHKYKIFICFKCNEIHLQGNMVESFYFIARKGKYIIMFAKRIKGQVSYNICSIFRSSNNESVKLQIFTL